MSLFFHPPRPSADPSTDPSSGAFTPLPSLSTVYLESLSARSLHVAESSPELLLEALGSRVGRVVRTGEVISLPQAGSSSQGELVAFRVVMTEPVLMGIVSIDGDAATEIVVGPHTPDGGSEGLSSSSHASAASHPNGSADSDVDSDKTIHPRPHSDDEDDDNDFDDDDDVEISASFLQQALLGPPLHQEANSSSTSVSSLPSTSSPVFPRSGAALSRLVPCALDRPPSSRTRSRTQGGPTDQDETVSWVRTRVLGEIGAFDGDWVSMVFWLDA
jgi:hypothetical protein